MTLMVIRQVEQGNVSNSASTGRKLLPFFQLANPEEHDPTVESPAPSSVDEMFPDFLSHSSQQTQHLCKLMNSAQM